PVGLGHRDAAQRMRRRAAQRRHVLAVWHDVLRARLGRLPRHRLLTTHAAAIAIPAALLVGIASRQIALTRREGLTPWKGGGFGMFATLDHGGHRRVRIVVDAPDR